MGAKGVKVLRAYGSGFKSLACRKMNEINGFARLKDRTVQVPLHYVIDGDYTCTVLFGEEASFMPTVP